MARLPNWVAWSDAEDEGTPCWLRKWIKPRSSMYGILDSMYGIVNIPYIHRIWECSSEYEPCLFFKAQVFLLKPSKSPWTTPGDGQWTCSWQFWGYTKLNLNHVEIRYAKNWHWYKVTCWAWYLYVQVNHSHATWHNVPECDKVFCLGILPHVRKI